MCGATGAAIAKNGLSFLADSSMKFATYSHTISGRPLDDAPSREVTVCSYSQCCPFHQHGVFLILGIAYIICNLIRAVVILATRNLGPAVPVVVSELGIIVVVCRGADEEVCLAPAFPAVRLTIVALVVPIQDFAGIVSVVPCFLHPISDKAQLVATILQYPSHGVYTPYSYVLFKH